MDGAFCNSWPDDANKGAGISNPARLDEAIDEEIAWDAVWCDSVEPGFTAGVLLLTREFKLCDAVALVSVMEIG